MIENELGIVIGTITSTEKVAGTSRLHIIKIDIGDKEVQIASGVPGDFEPNALVGKQVPIKIDVDPVKIRGIESNARFLAVSGKKEETVLGLRNRIGVLKKLTKVKSSNKKGQ